MYTSEAAGFEKLDVLSQRGMSNIQTCLQMLRQNRNITVDINDIRRCIDDPGCKDMQREGKTVGCFYVESPTMRIVLSKLQCSDFPTLVAASSIIRPGVGSSGMMDAYIWRYHNPDKFEYLHPVMAEHLSETFGIMVYQEDVLRIGIHYGGLSPTDADFLRRIMSGKERSSTRLNAIEKQFYGHARSKCYPETVSSEIWRQIKSFAQYSFSKAHSASFAVESMQCMYLKVHYPLEYMAAVINNRGGFYPLKVYVQEARRLGATIQLPCINDGTDYTNVKDSVLYLGTDLILGLNNATRESIAECRQAGPFVTMADLIERTGIELSQLHLLIRTGALRRINPDKKALLWQSYQFYQSITNTAAPVVLPLETTVQHFTLPHFDTHPDESFYDEMELLGFAVSTTPFDMLKTAFRGQILVSQMPSFLNKKVKMVGHYIVGKSLLTKKREPMLFGAFLTRPLTCSILCIFTRASNIGRCRDQAPICSKAL
ncbi:hypothetical protein MKQ70_32155 [Chitinophaga sedimenti]|uniref:helix-hairpin-helix domain-containing protein n=1 Tax=Chitinophaga sedimenti TaxID=2033606 RepID=UPI0020067995|nr:hypothetical protein [Chitinophaga sedimenti]MCK7559372.1 hypothetical protein [Chitinophaga sedimenti]